MQADSVCFFCHTCAILSSRQKTLKKAALPDIDCCLIDSFLHVIRLWPFCDTRCMWIHLHWVVCPPVIDHYSEGLADKFVTHNRKSRKPWLFHNSMACRLFCLLLAANFVYKTENIMCLFKRPFWYTIFNAFSKQQLGAACHFQVPELRMITNLT